jgi:hypothetical protein
MVSVKLKESQRALHSTWRKEDIFLEKKKTSQKCSKKQYTKIMLRD